MSKACGVPAFVVAILVAPLAPLFAPRIAPPRPAVPWRALDGEWTFDGARSRIPDATAGTRRSLRIEADPPLLVVREGEAEALAFWVGGPPVETRRGPLAVTRTVSRSGDGVVVEDAVDGGRTRRETLRIEGGEGGRLVRTVSPATGGAGAEGVLVYERKTGVSAGGEFPALPVSAALGAMALVLVAERGLRGTGSRRRRPAIRVA